uniref:Putative NDBP n=1 Tax=Superstitionia donensis TaxID=311983 RepID=A0A1V1WC73_9SCOR
MKTQLVFLIVALVLVQMFSGSDAEGFWGKLWSGVKSAASSILGKRGLKNIDQYDDFYEPDLSAADLKLLQELFR